VLYQGRNRKYYSITNHGKKHIKEFLEEWEDIRKIYEILKK
jgi:PadR family transcriptional regulator, regulatory protein PadR